MPLPVTFNTLTAPSQQLSLFDTQFAAVAALGTIPCTATGTNAIALTPFANTPTITSYPDLQPSFVFVAPTTSTALVTLNVSGVGARNAYKWNGLVACGAGDLIAGQIYRATPLLALNGGAGGFVVDSIGVNNNVTDLELVIDGGGTAITTGVKGYFHIPFGATIFAWRVMADQVGSIAVDVLRANGAVPTVSMIGAGNKPTLSASQFTEAAVSGWTSATLAVADWIGFNVVSATTVTRATVVLSVDKL